MIKIGSELKTNKAAMSEQRAVLLCRCAETTDSLIYLRVGQRWASVHSIAALLWLDVKPGQAVEIIAHGSDEEAAARKTEAVLQKETVF